LCRKVGRIYPPRKSLSETLLYLKFPEFSQDKVVIWQAHKDEKPGKEDSSYDMIIGMILLCNIGFTVDTVNKCLRWDQQIMSMIYNMLGELSIIKEAEES
jgi:hypothetical protein